MCLHSLHGYRSINGPNKQTGKWPITFKLSEGFIDLPVDVPCGTCEECLLKRSRDWAVRCSHEASLYKDNCFLTLTYNDESLPIGGTLNKKDMTDFLKRLRFNADYNEGHTGIRYFQCGEYGSRLKRPHHHVLLFNYDFADKTYFKNSPTGHPLYRSETLEKLWPYGYSWIGSVTYESAAYVARYVLKKRLRASEAELRHYYGDRVPEYVTMSRRPGIAKEWFDKFKNDVYPHDYVITANKIKLRPPRYYDDLYDSYDHKMYSKVKNARIKRAKLPRVIKNNETSRVIARQKVIRSRIELLQRNYEMQA